MILYFLLLRLFAFFGHEKAKKICQGQKNVLADLENWINALPVLKNIIWFHTASVGEFEQARPIMEKIKRERTNTIILLTFFSPSGYELRKDYKYADYVTYLPFATKKNAQTFIKIVQPAMAVFVKYEFWPAYLKVLYTKNIPTYLISAIFNKKQFFFHPLGFSYRKLLFLFTHLYVQDTQSQQMLFKHNIQNVTVTGDTRFDRVLQVKQQEKTISVIENFLKEKDFYNRIANNFVKDNVIVAGSVYEQDEILLARYFETHPNLKMIIVPHEITEKNLHFIFQLFKGRIVNYTKATPINVLHTHVLVVDTVGILSSIYRYADVAYVGGGFNKGIHNILEAAVYGIPVIFGPKYTQFREAVDMKQRNAAVSIKDYATLETALDVALQHKDSMGEQALNYINEERGATDKIYKELFVNKNDNSKN